jgi:hypothetical protein
VTGNLNDMIRRRDVLNREIRQAQAEADRSYADALDGIRDAISEMTAGTPHAPDWTERKHVQTMNLGTVAVDLGYPCEQCRPSLAVRWGTSQADFTGTPPPAGAVAAFVAALIEAETREDHVAAS